ncbi:MAG: UbiD family decarboxylase [Planctomycetes bacterium]|nr:UbiD family decarboxylase [Planctomycetota bacterium]
MRLAARGEVDLLRMPALKCWPLDGDPRAVAFGLSAEEAGTAAGGGRFITFAGVHSIDAQDEGAARPASHNVGMYRAQVIGGTRIAMHWHLHHDGAAHWRSWRARGRPMPLAICLGGEPVLPYAAAAPLPRGVSELLLAGFLAGRGIPLVKARTVPLRVPAQSEIVIEGYASTECGPPGYDPRPRAGAAPEPLRPGAVLARPSRDHTGFYSLPDRYPVVEVTAVTHRRGAIFPATVVGLPPQEDYYLGKATERVFLPLLRLLVPDLEDYHLPFFGTFHNCAFLKIRKEYALQARRVMAAVWGAGQLAWTKFLVVVDQGVDVHDEHAVLRALFERCHFARDVETMNGPLDILDHAAPRLGAGGKLGFDATRKLSGEEVGGVPLSFAPRLGSAGQAAAAALASRLGGAGVTAVAVPEIGLCRLVLVAVRKTAGGGGARAVEAVFAHAGDTPADCVIAVDHPADLADLDRVLLLLCAHCDPGRDVHRAGARIAFDATVKTQGDERGGEPVRDYPPLVEMSAEMQARVTERWSEYGF